MIKPPKRTRRHVMTAAWVAPLCVAACGAPGAETRQGAVTTPSRQPASIRVAGYTEGHQANTERNFEHYRKERPEVTLTYEMMLPYWEKLQASVLAGTQPDVFIMNGPNFLHYATSKELYDVSPLIQRDKLSMTKVFPEYLVSLYTWKGRTYGMPIFHATIGLYYNKALFAQAGVRPPASNWTWPDYLNVARQLARPDGSLFGTEAGPWGQSQGYNWILQNEAEVISRDKSKFLFDSARGIEAIQFQYDLVHAHRVAPTTDELRAGGNGEALFKAGKLAMMPSGPWQFGRLDDVAGLEWDVVPLPKGRRQACTIHGSSFCISTTSKAVEPAWAFLKQAGVSREGYVSQAEETMPASYEGSRYWATQNRAANAQVLVDAMSYSLGYPASLLADEWQRVIGNELNAGWTQKKPMKDATVEAARIGNEILRREQDVLRERGA